jgi:hypothetical protein
MVLIPSFTVYFAARAKEKKDEAKLQQANDEVKSSLSDELDAANELGIAHK